MARGSKPVPLDLNEGERSALAAMVRRHKTGQARAHHAGLRRAGVDQHGRGPMPWRQPAQRDDVAQALRPARAAGPGRRAAAGAPRKAGDGAVERLITLTLDSRPDGATHRSTRTTAGELGMSQTAVSRIWRAFALAPYRCDTFKLSTDPLFADEVRDIAGLSMTPPDRAPVPCVDEKPQIQATQGTAPVLLDLIAAWHPGQPERRTHDDKRNGTTDLFAASNVETGTVVGACKARHRATEFRAFLDEVEAAVPSDLDVPLVPTQRRHAQDRPRPRLAGQAPALFKSTDELEGAIWQTDFGLSYAGLAVLRALYYGTMGGLKIPADRLAAKLSPRTALASATFVAAGGYLVMAMPLGFPGLCAGLIVAGVGSSVQHPRASLLVTTSYG